MLDSTIRWAYQSASGRTSVYAKAMRNVKTTRNMYEPTLARQQRGKNSCYRKYIKIYYR